MLGFDTLSGRGVWNSQDQKIVPPKKEDANSYPVFFSGTQAGRRNLKKEPGVYFKTGYTLEITFEVIIT